MEHKNSEKQTPLQLRCRKILPGVSDMKKSKLTAAEGPKVDGTQHPASSLVSPTPEKLECRSKVKETSDFARRQLGDSFQHDGVTDQSAAVDRGNSHMISDDDDDDEENSFEPELSCGGSHMLGRSLKDISLELPDNYKTLANLFNRMESSIRLLGLQKMLPTFKNISTQVEVLTKRKFLCSHLAQMKHLFLEAIQIDKILVHDEKSLCMNPDMKITLLWDVMECPPSHQSATMALCEAFHARLVNFCNSHPEGTDIPEAVLPEPFNHRKDNMLFKTLPEGVSSESTEPLAQTFSHLPSFFQSRFFQKVIVPGTHKTQLLATPESFESLSSDDEAKDCSSLQKQRKPDSVKSPCEVISAYPGCTPVKVPSALDVVMTETPVQQTPKRAVPTPLGELVPENGKAVSEARPRSSARRLLIYSPSKTDGNVSGPVACRTEEDGTIRYSLQADTERSTVGEESTDAACDVSTVVNDETNNQMGIRRHKEMPTYLLDTFDTICLISRSTNCSLITKEELVHKILSNNFEIEEKSEVEEQLKLLEELVPDWICKKACSSGNFLYCINQSSDPKSIREKLAEAM